MSTDFLGICFFFFQWDLYNLYPTVVPNGIPAARGRRRLCEAAAGEVPGQGSTEQWIPLNAEGRIFPQKPQGDDLFLPPVSLDSSGDASHLTIEYNKREELRHLNPFHSKIFLNRYNCTAPLKSAFFPLYPAFKSRGKPLQFSLTKYLLCL